LSGADNDYAYFDDERTRFDPSDGRTLHQENARITAGDGLVHAGVDALGGRMSLVVLGHGRSEGVPGPLAQPASDAHRQLVRLLSALGYEHERIASDGERAHRVQLLASASLQRNRFTDLHELGMGQGTAADDLWLRGFARVGGSLRVLSWLEPTLIASVARDELRPDDPLAFTAPPRPSRRSTEAVALEPRVFGTIAGMPAELRPSLRAEWSQAEVRDATPGGTADTRSSAFAPTLRLAAGLEPVPALSLAASAATGRRLPSLFELFGDRALLDPNPELEPERSRTIDLSAVGRARSGALRASAELRGFVLWIDDMIRYERSSELTFRPENLAAARIEGLELGLNAAFGRNLALVSALTALHTENQLGNALAFRPPVELLVRPELSWSPPHLDRVVVFGEVQHVGFVYLDDARNDTSLPARTVFSLGCTLELLQRRMRLQARVRNLFDVRASDVLSRPLPGREVLAVVTVEEVGL
jgi:outer membrane receptor protein involved in Fe transport